MMRGVVSGMQMTALSPSFLDESATPWGEEEAAVGSHAWASAGRGTLRGRGAARPASQADCLPGARTWAWLPAEAVTTPADALSAGSCAMRLYAPRSWGGGWAGGGGLVRRRHLRRLFERRGASQGPCDGPPRAGWAWSAACGTAAQRQPAGAP